MTEQKYWSWFANLSEQQKEIICNRVNNNQNNSIGICKKLLIEIKKQHALIKTLYSKKAKILNNKTLVDLQAFLDLKAKKPHRVRQSDLEEKMHMYYIYDIIPLLRQGFSWREITKALKIKYNIKYSHVWIKEIFERVIEKYNIQL